MHSGLRSVSPMQLGFKDKFMQHGLFIFLKILDRQRLICSIFLKNQKMYFFFLV
jgi:hypothetical protein